MLGPLHQRWARALSLMIPGLAGAFSYALGRPVLNAAANVPAYATQNSFPGTAYYCRARRLLESPEGPCITASMSPQQPRLTLILDCAPQRMCEPPPWTPPPTRDLEISQPEPQGSCPEPPQNTGGGVHQYQSKTTYFRMTSETLLQVKLSSYA